MTQFGNLQYIFLVQKFNPHMIWALSKVIIIMIEFFCKLLYALVSAPSPYMYSEALCLAQDLDVVRNCPCQKGWICLDVLKSYRTTLNNIIFSRFACKKKIFEWPWLYSSYFVTLTIMVIRWNVPYDILRNKAGPFLW